MSLMTKIFGFTFLLIGVLFPFWRALSVQKELQSAKRSLVLFACLLAVFSGLALILLDRVTDFTVPGIGTIHAITEQAITDAKTVADLKSRVENQSATVDLIASQAAKANELSQRVATQIDQAEADLKSLNKSIKEADDGLVRLEQEDEFKTLYWQLRMTTERASKSSKRSLKTALILIAS